MQLLESSKLIYLNTETTYPQYLLLKVTHLSSTKKQSVTKYKMSNQTKEVYYTQNLSKNW